jgi:hypothetical protein
VQEAMPEPPTSVPLKLTVTFVLFHPAAFAAGEAAASAVGFVLSTFTVWDALPVFPATSLHVAFRVSVPSPEEVELVVQFAASIPDPPALSDQFHVTVTSVLVHPFVLAAGDWVGEAVGAVVSQVFVVHETGIDASRVIVCPLVFSPDAR